MPTSEVKFSAPQASGYAFFTSLLGLKPQQFKFLLTPGIIHEQILARYPPAPPPVK